MTFVSYRVYAPAAEVEIDGVISYNDILDMDNRQDLLKVVGKGKFVNARMDQVDMLTVKRLYRNYPSICIAAVARNDVKVTFSGSGSSLSISSIFIPSPCT